MTFSKTSPTTVTEMKIRHAVRRSVFSQTLVTIGTATAMVTTNMPMTMAMPEL